MGLIKEEARGASTYIVGQRLGRASQPAFTDVPSTSDFLGSPRLRAASSRSELAVSLPGFFSRSALRGDYKPFVRANSRIKALRNEEIAGTTLCRPAITTHELDQLAGTG
jgi:hypothetical protein